MGSGFFISDTLIVPFTKEPSKVDFYPLQSERNCLLYVSGSLSCVEQVSTTVPKSAILRFCPSRETCWGVPSPNPALRLAPHKAAAIPEYPRHGKNGIQPTKAPQTAPKQDGVQRLVDIEQKMAEGKGRGYERWATMHNLKQMAATLNVYQEYGFTSPEQLEAAVDTAYQEMRQTSGELKALETKLQGKKELQQQVLAYAKTKPARDGLKAQKSEKARAAYRQANESDFIIAEAAARYFKAHGITKLPARKALQAEIEQLISEKDGLYNTYHEQKQRFKELQTVKRNIDQILRREEPRRRKEQSHER